MNTVSEVVAQVVADHVTEVFALMGNGNAYFTDALAHQGKVRMTGLRHEAGVVASADAYYRVSRKIAVATTTLGRVIPIQSRHWPKPSAPGHRWSLLWVINQPRVRAPGMWIKPRSLSVLERFR